jgi:phosphoribosylglycinamide formyltransferase 2
MLLGSGELGKEVVIELQRYGVEVIAVDRYANAPAMQVAHRSYVIDMLNADALKEIIRKENPHYIIPEVEAIATTALVELEREGFNVIPTAKATLLTMNREGIRSLAALELGLKTSAFRFAGTREEFETAISEIGFPCVVKPIMSSSGKGQSVVRSQDDIAQSWTYAQEGGRSGAGRVIVEGFVDFDFEITLLTISHRDGVSFCEPIGHRQERGDYKESWQPQAMSAAALAKAEQDAAKVVKALGGYGLFGVEFFVKGDDVYFSELSPRPHDTGMVTLISQNLSEFALHVRAILGLPIPNITLHGPSASAVIMGEGTSDNIQFENIDAALQESNTQLRLFGKPTIKGERRLGVCLAMADNVEQARAMASRAAAKVSVITA